MSLNELKKCVNCGNSDWKWKDPELMECSKCHTLQYIGLYESSYTTRVLITSPSIEAPLTLSAFGKVIKDMISSTEDDVTKVSLLKSHSFNLTYKDDAIRTVHSIHPWLFIPSQLFLTIEVFVIISITNNLYFVLSCYWVFHNSFFLKRIQFKYYQVSRAHAHYHHYSWHIIMWYAITHFAIQVHHTVRV